MPKLPSACSADGLLSTVLVLAFGPLTLWKDAYGVVYGFWDLGVRRASREGILGSPGMTNGI